MATNLKKAEEFLKEARKFWHNQDEQFKEKDFDSRPILGFLFKADTYDGINPNEFISSESNFYQLYSNYKDAQMVEDVFAAINYIYNKISNDLSIFPQVIVQGGNDLQVKIYYELPEEIQNFYLHQRDLEGLALGILQRLQSHTKGDLYFDDFVID